MVSRVMEEWSLLKISLTDGIYITVFEDRIDLLSVLIVGPSGTPYHDAMFAFDIQVRFFSSPLNIFV